MRRETARAEEGRRSREQQRGQEKTREAWSAQRLLLLALETMMLLATTMRRGGSEEGEEGRIAIICDWSLTPPVFDRPRAPLDQRRRGAGRWMAFSNSRPDILRVSPLLVGIERRNPLPVSERSHWRIRARLSQSLFVSLLVSSPLFVSISRRLPSSSLPLSPLFVIFPLRLSPSPTNPLCVSLPLRRIPSASLSLSAESVSPTKPDPFRSLSLPNPPQTRPDLSASASLLYLLACDSNSSGSSPSPFQRRRSLLPSHFLAPRHRSSSRLSRRSLPVANDRDSSS